MKHYKKYFKQYKKPMIIAPCFKFIETVSDIIIPLLVANMIDVGVANSDPGYIFTYGAIVVGLNIVSILCAIICQKNAAKASMGIGAGIREDLYKHINTFSHAELDKFGTATINNRMTHDVARVQNAIGMFVRMVTRTPFLLIGSIVMALIIDAKLSLLFLIITPLILAAIFLILKFTEPLYAKTQKDLDKVAEITKENLQGVRVIRAFNKQETEEARFKGAAIKLRKSAIKVVDVSTLLNPITGTIINFAIVAVIWLGGIQVNIGGLATGQIIAFINYLTQISMALVALANIIIAFIKAFNCAGRINEIFDTKPSIIETVHEPISLEVSKETPKIEFKNVSFSYGKDSKYAIKNLNLKIYPGETIGIIGGTGSGKSSIIYLIPRFYDATSGSVKVDGVDVKEYSFSQLRDKIGYVPQKAILFKGTLKENLTWRKADASFEELDKAIKISQCEDFVKELPNKYDYIVQTGGKNFSGGQRQRLTIARALVGSPEILILDDSASALDFATDANLRKAIKKDIKNSTVILVSQRAGTVKNANKIVVLDGGNVVGIGSHKELLETCTVYKEIYESQTK